MCRRKGHNESLRVWVLVSDHVLPDFTTDASKRPTWRLEPGQGVMLTGYKGQVTYDAGYIYCPYMPDGTDLRPMWLAARRKQASDRGWCVKLFDEMER